MSSPLENGSRGDWNNIKGTEYHFIYAIWLLRLSIIKMAERRLDAWIKLVRDHGPDPMRQALSAFTKWKPEILAFLRLEAINGGARHIMLPRVIRHKLLPISKKARVLLRAGAFRARSGTDRIR